MTADLAALQHVADNLERMEKVLNRLNVTIAETAALLFSVHNQADKAAAALQRVASLQALIN